MSHQQPSGPDEAQKKLSPKEFLTHPVFIGIVVMLAVGIWFGTSFVNASTNPTTENSINYNGMAEVLDVGSSTKKCNVQIRREDGRETRQRMPRSDCGKFHKGDVIEIKNGQYVRTSPVPIMPSR